MFHCNREKVLTERCVCLSDRDAAGCRESWHPSSPPFGTCTGNAFDPSPSASPRLPPQADPVCLVFDGGTALCFHVIDGWCLGAQGQPVTGLSYDSVLGLIKGAGRPLALAFEDCAPTKRAPAPTPAAPTATASATAPAPAPAPALVPGSGRRYKVLQRSVIRAGFEMSSPKVGELEIGMLVRPRDPS